MTSTRPAGVLLLTAVLTMIAAAAIVVPSGLTLSPADPAGTLAAVRATPVPHMIELALDVAGWLALAAAALTMTTDALPRGLLAASGLAGLLHDAGNLALAQLTDPAVAQAVLLTAKWTVNLAGLLWVAATAAHTRVTPGLRRAGLVAALSGLVAVALPWATTPSPAVEQLGYALHLPIMAWYGVLGWRYARQRHLR